MTIDLGLGLLIAAVVVCGLATGASLDQSIKQLPARKGIGVAAYAAYSRAADLRNGLWWYVLLGIAWLALNVGAAIAGWADGASGDRALALGLLVIAVTGHIMLTAFAAPTLHSQRGVVEDNAALERVFDRFARLQALRAAMDGAALAVAVWALAATITDTSTLG
jgi:hypothetical protein